MYQIQQNFNCNIIHMGQWIIFCLILCSSYLKFEYPEKKHVDNLHAFT